MDVNLLFSLEKRDFFGIETLCQSKISQGVALPEIWFYLAMACQEQCKHEQALQALQNILASEAGNANVQSLHAAILASLKFYEDALTAAKRALEIEPDLPQHLNNAGTISQQSGNLDLAKKFYIQTLAVDQCNVSASVNLGSVFLLSGEYEQAQLHCKQAIQHIPDCVDLYNVLAEAYIHTNDWDRALEACCKGLNLDKSYAFLHFRKGLVLSYLRNFKEAQQSLDTAIALHPEIAKSYFSYEGMTEQEKYFLRDGINARLIFLEKAYAQQVSCDWSMWDQYPQVLLDYVALSRTKEIARSLGFRVFNRPISGSSRLKLMERISSSIAKDAVQLNNQPYTYHHSLKPQLRIGYLSADFYQHPTSILTRQMYRLHDRLKFKIYGYSVYRAKSDDIYQKELASSCDVFRDVSEMDAIQIADIIHRDEIDILIDLGQYVTANSKLEVLALKPAPIQINFLAFMATTGAEFIDYAIVDNYVCPEPLRNDWSESLIRLPNSLFMYDNKITNAHTTLSRRDYGLPESSIVFCSFNNNLKLEPIIFSTWMSILKAVPESVLWLLITDPVVCENLTNEAIKHGIHKERIVFAEKISLELHIQRYQLADIFLDTHWFNGHTTALEALWQGLPVLTWCGEVASSRVAASFLNVLGMHELITHTSGEYQEKAIYYATHHDPRKQLKDKLLRNRDDSPLFNTALTVKHLELGYELVWNRYMNNLNPKDINVPPITELKW